MQQSVAGTGQMPVHFEVTDPRSKEAWKTSATAVLRLGCLGNALRTQDPHTALSGRYPTGMLGIHLYYEPHFLHPPSEQRSDFCCNSAVSYRWSFVGVQLRQSYQKQECRSLVIKQLGLLILEDCPILWPKVIQFWLLSSSFHQFRLMYLCFSYHPVNSSGQATNITL